MSRPDDESRDELLSRIGEGLLAQGNALRQLQTEVRVLLEQRAEEGPVVSQITSGLTDLADAINARMTLIEDRLDRLEGKPPEDPATLN